MVSFENSIRGGGPPSQRDQRQDIQADVPFSVDQVLGLLRVLDCEVDFVVKTRSV